MELSKKPAIWKAPVERIPGTVESSNGRGGTRPSNTSKPESSGSAPRFYAYKANVFEDLDQSFHIKDLERVGFVIDKKSIYSQISTVYFQRLKSALAIILLRFVLKVISCLLYVLRVVLDSPPYHKCVASGVKVCEPAEMIATTQVKRVNWDDIIWIYYNYNVLWLAQVILSAVALTMALVTVFFQSKWIKVHILNVDFILEIILSVPVILTICSSLRNLFVPIYLNCWLARSALKDLFTHRAVGATYCNFNFQLVDVMSTMFCLMFTGICSFEHLQRGSVDMHYDLFQSLYVIMVTLTTVGYGDYFPDIWPSQLFMITMMGIAFIILPKQFENLARTWIQMQRLGGSYNKNRILEKKHVVVCSTELTADLVMEFLVEFFSQKHLQNFHVVFLASSDLIFEVRQILQLPVWVHRNTFIKGSCLKDEDLSRAKVYQAEACFFLGADNSVDKTAADQHTILRSWAVKDFAPNVPQYVQIFRPQSIVHVNFAEHIVCEDEFKYAMLAYNCMIPGTSTLITLLLHTSRGKEGQDATEPWLQLYGKCAGNEIYHSVAGQSKIFSRFIGKSFSFAAVHAHQIFGILLIGLQPKNGQNIMLNPGSGYLISKTDICFYLSITSEEDILLLPVKNNLTYFESGTEKSSQKAIFLKKVLDEQAAKLRVMTANTFSKKLNIPGKASKRQRHTENDIILGLPPVTPYVGTSCNLCYLLKEKRSTCCLQLNEECTHCKHKCVEDYQWTNRIIMLVADHVSLGIYNFILPLRAYFHHQHALNPIVLLLEKSLDDLLKAGINLADNVVVVNREASNALAEEDDLSDCNTIVGVQTVFKYFPNVNITTELSQSSNMRFMHFEANNAYAAYLSEVEKHEKEKGSIISFMFRLQFASGVVFSASMVDTLLYQAFVKGYLIPIVRLLLGIDQAPGSAFLTSIEVDKKESWMTTYGSLFVHLCSFNGDIPMAIFRTQHDLQTATPRNRNDGGYNRMAEQDQISKLIKSRMANLNMQPQSYSDNAMSSSTNKLSYVIINPNCDLELEEGDILFLLRPSS